MSRLVPHPAEPKLVAVATRRCLEIHYARLLETLFFGRLTKAMVESRISAQGMENVDQALSNGQGAILLLAHFGSFLLPLPYLGYMGYKVNQLTGKQRHVSLLDERIWQWRKHDADKLPVRYIQVERFLRPVYRAFQQNELVAVAFDGRDGTQWATVPFLGGMARFSTGPFMLARRTGAAIIPTFTLRNANDTHTLIFEKPLDLGKATISDLHQQVIADVEQYAAFFATYVMKYPCHFGMTVLKHKTQASPDYQQFIIDQ